MHSLLKRQLKKLYKDLKNIPDYLDKVIKIVNQSYHDFDKDRIMLERSLDLTSHELLDINEKLQSEIHQLEILKKELKNSEERYKAMFENNRAIKLLIDPINGHIVDANKAACDFYGYTKKNLLKMKIYQINIEDKNTLKRILNNISENPDTYYLFQHKLASGKIRDVEEYNGPITIKEKTFIYSIVHDITNRLKAEKKILHQALHDSLTGLPNRTSFYDHLNRTISRTKRSKFYLFAILFIDLDRFKLINDNLGHSTGDKLLKKISTNLNKLIYPGDIMARIGGDEFAILLDDLNHENEAIVVAQRILAQFKKPISINNEKIYCSASIGIAYSSSNYQSSDEIISDADNAMHKAKNQGKSCYEIFDINKANISPKSFHLENDLRDAILSNQLKLHYQPIISLSNLRVEILETLIRWEHPKKKLIMPNEFIPIAEETGLIVPIGEWIIIHAIEHCKELILNKKHNITVAVNVSIRQLYDNNLLILFKRLLPNSKLPKNSIKLEITESMYAGIQKNILDYLKKFKNLGIPLSIDDFGTGYSSLSYLSKLPINSIKIDKSFIRNVHKNHEHAKITKAIIALAHSLNLKVIAEGVENAEELNFLKKLNCDYIQGYYIGKPIPFDKLLKYLETKPYLQKLQNDIK